MTVTTAPPRRKVIDLGADATILDAARSLAAVESADVVLVVPSGAPLTRNAVFLEALRRRAGDRRIVLVSPEARARSLASSVHMKSFASISALDRHELDATEHLSDARRAVMKTMVRPAVPRWAGAFPKGPAGGGSLANYRDSRNTVTPSLVARASRPLWRGHPAHAFVGAGRPSTCGRDGLATSNTVTLFCKPL